MMNTVALSMGSNVGDRQHCLQAATEWIQTSIGSVVALSGVYETEPWGDFGEAHPLPFLNQALVVETPLDAFAVLDRALQAERELGRKRSHEDAATTHRIYHSRPIDIDLIFFNNDIINTPRLTIPHPKMHLRRFVLEPLAELMPDYRHPVLGKTVSDMLAAVEANG